MQLRILVTGSGGIGGVNFIHALRYGAKVSGIKLFIIGTEFDAYYLRFPELDEAVKSPRHSDPSFLMLLKELVAKYKLEFVHPNPSSEAKVIAEHVKEFDRIKAGTFLPNLDAISPNKETIWKKMRESNVPVPETQLVKSAQDVEQAFRKIGSPLWLRVKEGAGARLALKVSSSDEALMWIKLNISQGRSSSIADYMVQEFMPGRDIAFDSLWCKGKFVSSSARERIEYPLKHISLTGITGTPSVARIIHDDKITKLGMAAVKALDPKPNGFYSTDIKEDEQGNPMVTEVDGKWHTTASLWGYALAKAMQDNRFNVAFTYLMLGTGKRSLSEIEVCKDMYPEGLVLIRQMDSGVILYDENRDKVWRIL